MPSTSLLHEAMTLHEQYPSFTTNRAWIDGQKASLAGRICLLAGAERADGGLGLDAGRHVIYQGYKRDVPELAAELTGLTAMEARWLLHRKRTSAEIRGAVREVDDQLPISGRPYWVDTECEHRYITRAGKIVVAQHRRAVFAYDFGVWGCTIFPSREQAHRYARLTAVDLKAVPYRLTTPPDRRSIHA